MAILRLAFSNILHRLIRNSITLLAMALASAVLTSGLSISQGSAKLAFTEYRTYFDADIVVFTPGFLGASPVERTASNIGRKILPDSGFNPIVQLFPELEYEGFLAENSWQYKPFSTLESEDLSRLEGVAGVTSFYLMPAHVKGLDIGLRTAPDDYGKYISEGREARPNSDLVEVVLNAYSGIPAKVGDILEISVDAFQLDADGIPYTDVTSPQAIYMARVVGLVSWPSRAFTWIPPQGHSREEEASYVHAAEMYLTEQDWGSIWNLQSGGTPYPALSLRIKVENMSSFNSIAEAVRSSMPHNAVFTVPELVSYGLRYGLLDKFYRAPAYLWAGEQKKGLPIAKEEFGSLAAILLYVNAGMLMASQMLAAVSSRRSEIGILKAIGARRKEVTAMILCEALFLALMGGASGFLLMRLAALHQSITNSVPLAVIVGSTLREMGLVLGLTSCCEIGRAHV